MHSWEDTPMAQHTTRCRGWMRPPQKGRTVVALLVLLAVTGVAPLARAADWTTQVIDSLHPQGAGTGIAIQPAGQVHVSYQGTGGLSLRHATNAYGTAPWTTEVADAGAGGITGQGSSVAVDSAGCVHICYREQDIQHAVLYATNASGTWSTPKQVLADAMIASGIAVDSARRVHILAVGNDLHIYYATNAAGDGSTLAVTPLPDDHGSYFPQIAADAGRHAHAVYLSNGNLRYANNAGGTWPAGATIEAGVNVTSPIALSLDAAGYAHVVYLDQNTQAVRYATNAPGGTWQAPVTIDTAQNSDYVVASVVTSGQISSLTGGQVVVNYFDRLAGELRQTIRDTGGTWQAPALLAPAAGAADASIATDSSACVHLVYTDTGTGELKHLSNAPDPHGADVTVSQTRTPNSIIAGRQVIYAVTVMNLGVDTATGVVLTDSLPAGSVFISADGGATFDPGSNTVTRNIGTIAKGAAVTTNITILAPAGPTMTNVASVTSTGGADFKSANDSASLTDPVAPVPQHPLVLGVTNGVGGKIMAQGNLAAYSEGAVIPVTATPDPGYRVRAWHGTQNDGSTGTNNTVLIGTGDQTTVQVEFEKIPRRADRGGRRERKRHPPQRHLSRRHDRDADSLARSPLPGLELERHGPR